jgi:hypothetical protein
MVLISFKELAVIEMLINSSAFSSYCCLVKPETYLSRRPFISMVMKERGGALGWERFRHLGFRLKLCETNKKQEETIN